MDTISRLTISTLWIFGMTLVTFWHDCTADYALLIVFRLVSMFLWWECHFTADQFLFIWEKVSKSSKGHIRLNFWVCGLVFDIIFVVCCSAPCLLLFQEWTNWAGYTVKKRKLIKTKRRKINIIQEYSMFCLTNILVALYFS